MTSKRTLQPSPAVGWALRRAREALEPVLVRTRRLRGAPGSSHRTDLPVPPRRLRARTGAPGVRAFVQTGPETAAQLAGLVRAAGRDPTQLRSVLDFGCGSGRVMPHFALMAPAADCVGCDVDEAAIHWAAHHHRRLGWSLTSFHPPLPYAAGSFDLVYAVRVFSHLDRGLTGLWLEELRRVLAPDGLALLSVHGADAFERFRTGALSTSWCAPSTFRRAPLGADEFVFAPYRRSFWTDGDLPGVGREYGLAFHGADHARALWRRSLQVVEVRPSALTDWQDVVVAVKC